jgi:hypothetical protein
MKKIDDFNFADIGGDFDIEKMKADIHKYNNPLDDKELEKLMEEETDPELKALMRKCTGKYKDGIYDK